MATHYLKKGVEETHETSRARVYVYVKYISGNEQCQTQFL